MLSPGTRIGPYEIVGSLGAGGMGVVYRGRDPRLNRDVAIKLLPAAFNYDPERLRRFEQEALATSALNHPNILTIYDVGREGDAPYLVAELLDGSELRALMDSPMAPRLAIDLARQVAQGLAAAHGKGIVHRDLKPENLFVTTDGRVKILDFGLAKLTVAEPTVTVTSMRHTEPGAVMGTVSYMAPEQVRGLAADGRTDIFAFGAILYEMLSARRAFCAETPAETMTAILKHDPPDLEQVDLRISPAVDRLVRRCLEKNPDRRFQSAHDLAFALETLSGSSGASTASAAALVVPPGAPSRGWARRGIAAIVVGTIAAIGGYVLANRWQSGAEGQRLHLTVALPEDVTLSSSSAAPMALSPDGRQIAFVATKGTTTQLWVRSLSEPEAVPIPGTEGIPTTPPFWSPDSLSLGYFATDRLMRVDVPGGRPRIVCEASNTRGAAWTRDGSILFAQPGGPLMRVAASGGTPKAFGSLDQATKEMSRRWPQILPDGEHYLFWSRREEPNTTGIYLGTLGSGDATLVAPALVSGLYSAGHLLYLRDSALVAQPFDVRTATLHGDSRVVAPAVSFAAGLARAGVTVSDTGVLAYSKGSNSATELRWFDRQGTPGSVVPTGPPTVNLSVALSRDDGWAAVARMDVSTGAYDLWQLELDRDAPIRLTTEPGQEWTPVWSPDGSRLAYSRTPGGIAVRDLTSPTAADRLIVPSGTVNDWSPDGSRLIYHVQTAPVKTDLMTVELSPDARPQPFLASQFSESHAQFSPDGRWVAYVSDESGQLEVYLRRFPEGDGQRRISNAGGDQPRWRADGREIFYLDAGRRLVSVEVTPGAQLEPDTPRVLFSTNSFVAVRIGFNYAVTRDGQRFLVDTTLEQSTSDPISLLVNWMR